jgi:hypothetical protein
MIRTAPAPLRFTSRDRMLLVRVPFPSSPPGSTRWSMLTHGEIKQCRKVQQASAPHGLPGQARQRRRRKSFSRHVQRFPGSLRTPSLRRSRICGAPLTRCTASGTRHSDAQKIPFSQRPCARVLPTTTHRKRFAPGNRREAKRRKAHVPTISAQQRQTSPFADASARLRATLGGAPAFRRFTAALTTGYYPDGSAPEPGFRKTRRAGVLPIRRMTSCVKHAPCGPVLLPVDRCPRPPGSGSHSHPRAGTASRCRLPKVPSRKAPLVRRDFAHVTKMRTIVKPKVTKKETFAGPPGARP